MRYALPLAALLFVATPAVASTISVASIEHTRSHTGATAMNALVQLGTGGFIVATVPIDLSDVGTTFTITADNADDFGLDWEFATTYIAGIINTSFTMQVGTSLGGDELKTKRVFGGPLRSETSLVDFRLQVQEWSPTSVRVRGSVSYITPEPTAAALLLLGLAGLLPIRLK